MLFSTPTTALTSTGSILWRRIVRAASFGNTCRVTDFNEYRDVFRSDIPWLYEVDEKLEADRPDGTKDFLLGVGAEYLVQDFAAVAAFALNITCTPDLDLTRRLVPGHQGALGVKHSPKHYIGRVFESRIEPQEEDASLLKDFLRDLVGLERRTYKAVMRSIRRYVTGLHRFSDDLDLASPRRIISRLKIWQ